MTNEVGLFDRLKDAATQGTLDDPNRTPTKKTIGPVRDGDAAAVRKAVEDLRAKLSVIAGDQGSESLLDKALTARDLIQGGMLTIDAGSRRFGLGTGLVLGNGTLSFGGVDNSGFTTTVTGFPYLTAAPTPTGLTASGTFKAVILTWALIDYINHGYTEVWRAPDNNLGHAVLVGSSTGRVYVDTAGINLGVTYWYWVREVTNDTPPMISSFNAGVGGGTPGGAGLVGGVDLGPLIIEAGNLANGSVTAAKLAAQAVTWTKFATDIEPVLLVSSLPLTKQTNVVFNTTDGKLYKWDETLGAYTPKFAAADIAGTLTNAQIASLAASKITGQLTDAQLASIAAAKISGQLTDAQIASIDAAKITGTLIADVITGEIGGANLIRNSDFNSTAIFAPLADFWSSYIIGNATPAANPWYVSSFGGADNGQFQSAHGTLGVGFSRIGILQEAVTCGVIAGGPVTISAYTSQTANGSTLHFLVEAFNSANTSLGLSEGYVTPTPGWNRYSKTFVVPANTIRVNVFIAAEGDGVGDTILNVDKVQLEIGNYLTAYAPKPDEILPGSIGTTEIAPNSVTTQKIVTGAIVTNKIAANAVTANEIAAQSITTAKLAAGAVTANEIAANTIVAANIAAQAITTPKLAAGAVTANEIAANTIVAANIAAAAITAATIAAGAVTTAKLAAGAVVTATIAAGAVTANEIAANAVTTAALAADAVTAGKIAAGAVNAQQIAAGAISTDKLLVTGRGAALNDDPAGSDLSAWLISEGSLSIVTPSPSASGTTALRITSSGGSLGYGNIQTKLVPASPGKTYRVSVWLRTVSGSGLNYIRLYFYDISTGLITYIVPGLESRTLDSNWNRYRGNVVAPVGTTRVSLGFLTNYQGGGVVDIQDARIEEAADYDLIVDGAIITTKLAANAIAVGSLAVENGAIRRALIQDLAVDDAKIANVSGGKITANSVAADRIVANSLTSVQIAAEGITAASIDTRGLIIKDAAGNVVLASGTALPFNLRFGANTTNLPANNATVGATFGVDIGGQITTGNVSTYIQAAAIDTAYIKDAAITTAKIGDAAITNAKIGDTIQSDNFVHNSVGWRIQKSTDTIEVQNVIARGDIQATSLNAATGTFTGTLVGVNGTFSGTLTAGAIILAGQALFQPVYANSSSVATANYAWSSCLTSPSVNPGSTGSVAITVTADWVGQVYAGGGGESADTYSAEFPKFRIVRNRDGAVLITWSPRGSGFASGGATTTYLDVPGGATTYSLQHVINEGIVSATESHTYYRTILVQGAVR